MIKATIYALLAVAVLVWGAHEGGRRGQVLVVAGVLLLVVAALAVGGAE